MCLLPIFIWNTSNDYVKILNFNIFIHLVYPVLPNIPNNNCKLILLEILFLRNLFLCILESDKIVEYDQAEKSCVQKTQQHMLLIEIQYVSVAPPQYKE